MSFDPYYRESMKEKNDSLLKALKALSKEDMDHAYSQSHMEQTELPFAPYHRTMMILLVPSNIAGYTDYRNTYSRALLDDRELGWLDTTVTYDDSDSEDEEDVFMTNIDFSRDIQKRTGMQSILREFTSGMKEDRKRRIAMLEEEWQRRKRMQKDKEWQIHILEVQLIWEESIQKDNQRQIRMLEEELKRGKRMQKDIKWQIRMLEEELKQHKRMLEEELKQHKRMQKDKQRQIQLDAIWRFLDAFVETDWIIPEGTAFREQYSHRVVYKCKATVTDFLEKMINMHAAGRESGKRKLSLQKRRWYQMSLEDMFHDKTSIYMLAYLEFLVQIDMKTNATVLIDLVVGTNTSKSGMYSERTRSEEDTSTYIDCANPNGYSDKNCIITKSNRAMLKQTCVIGVGQFHSQNVPLAHNQCKRLTNEEKQTEDETGCKICYGEKACVVFLPCSHMIACETCSSKLQHCAMCRSLIRGSFVVELNKHF